MHDGTGPFPARVLVRVPPLPLQGRPTGVRPVSPLVPIGPHIYSGIAVRSAPVLRPRMPCPLLIPQIWTGSVAGRLGWRYSDNPGRSWDLAWHGESVLLFVINEFRAAAEEPGIVVVVYARRKRYLFEALHKNCFHVLRLFKFFQVALTVFGVKVSQHGVDACPASANVDCPH